MTKQLFKNTALFMVMLFLAYSVSAQKIEWGTKNKASSRWYSPTVLMEDGKSLFTTYSDEFHVMIERHNEKGSLVYSHPIQLSKLNGTKAKIEYVNYLKDKFVVFASIYDNSTDKTILYSVAYDGKNGKQVGKEKKLFEVPVEKRNLMGKFLFFVSPDKSKVLVNHFADYKKEGKIKDRYKLFDCDMNMLLEKTEILNKKEIDYSTMDYVIDNEGSVFYFKKMSSGESYIVSYDATKDYEKWEEKIDISKLDINQSVGYIKFGFDSKNDLIITGLCFKEQKLNGCMYLKIDNKSKETKIFKIHKIENFSKYGTLFISQSLHFNSNDGVVFINAYAGEVFSGYQNDELVIFNFTPEGELSWNKVITKSQINWDRVSIFQYIFMSPGPINRQFFSYVSGINQNKLFIIYNDLPKNLLKNKEGKQVGTVKRYRKTIPVLCSIDLSTGEMGKKQLFDPKLMRSYIKPTLNFQKDFHSDLITLGQFRAKYQIVRIKLDDKS